MDQTQTSPPAKAVWTRPQSLQNSDAIKKNPDLARLVLNEFIIHTPVIDLQLAHENSILKQKQLWKLIENHDILLLTSPSAIRFLNTQLKNETHSLADLTLKNIIFIGQKTHQEFTHLGGQAKQTIIAPPGQENSTDLAAILNQGPQSIIQPNQSLPYKILHPTSTKTSAKQWQSKLDADLFSYTKINLYENHIARQYQKDVQERVWLPTAWFFFSPSAVEAVAELSQTRISNQPWQAWCIGPATQKAAHKHGFSQIFVSSQAKAEILLTDFIQMYKSWYY